MGLGSPMHSSRVCHCCYERRWNIFSTLINHTLRLGFNCTNINCDNHSETLLSSLLWLVVPPTSGATMTPLYYAALCGFQYLVEHLIIEYSHHMNARSGCFVTPLVAALSRRHFQTAELLHHNGADVNVRCYGGETPLHSASWFGDFKMIQVLLNFRADVNVWSDEGWTPMHYVSQGFQHSVIPNVYQPLPDVARLLLEHGRKRADL